MTLFHYQLQHIQNQQFHLQVWLFYQYENYENKNLVYSLNF